MYQSLPYSPTILFKRKEETLIDYWVSFFPTAPLFGGKWRFQPEGGAELKAAPAAKPKAKKKAKVAKPAAKPVAKAKSKAKPKAPKPAAVAKAPKPAEAPVAPKVAEPVAKVVEATPKAAPAKPKLAPAKATTVDDLTTIRGVGPKIAALLKENGVTSYAQIAQWSERDVDEWDVRLGTLPGRIERDDWVGQAKELSAS